MKYGITLFKKKKHVACKYIKKNLMLDMHTYIHINVRI